MNSKFSKISLIAAISQNRVIGNENKLLWHIPQDLQRFRALTSGHPVIMGRKTYESIGRPLPNRTNIIVTRDRNFAANKCLIAHSLEEAIEIAQKHLSDFEEFQKVKNSVPSSGVDPNEIFVIGGGQIYQEAIKFAHKLYLTIVHQDFSGDAIFPEYSKFKQEAYKYETKAENLSYTFIDLLK
ncbi:dihydrofolate reductase [Candidatus Microgenomates bacterium]|nr:MAG: dihydrofolate reductase [Candidatus Microgenomates bacterium]